MKITEYLGSFEPSTASDSAFNISCILKRMYSRFPSDPGTKYCPFFSFLFGEKEKPSPPRWDIYPVISRIMPAAEFPHSSRWEGRLLTELKILNSKSRKRNISGRQCLQDALALAVRRVGWEGSGIGQPARPGCTFSGNFLFNVIFYAYSAFCHCTTLRCAGAPCLRRYVLITVCVCVCICVCVCVGAACSGIWDVAGSAESSSFVGRADSI